jgi:hypothetical protein
MSPQLLEAPARTTSRVDERVRAMTVGAGAGSPWPGRLRFWRRRVVVVVSLLTAAFLLTGLISRVGAEAELEDKVDGHVVVQPGETLWDVAVDTAPPGMDAREHLAAVRELNDLHGSHVEAWTVVLIPAR